jgi:type I restriction enzyme S subunit
LTGGKEEQQEIIRRVEALFKLADIIEKRVTRATAQTEKLTQAILAKAFRGELARREGRPYETASALLARIEAQRKGVKSQRKCRE